MCALNMKPLHLMACRDFRTFGEGQKAAEQCFCFRVRPIGSTSESDTEFDRMKQVGVISRLSYTGLR